MQTKAKRTTRTAHAQTVLYRAFDFSQHYGKVLSAIGNGRTYRIQPLDGSQVEYIPHNDIIATV